MFVSLGSKSNKLETGEVLPEVGVEDLSDEELSQTSPTDSHAMFESARPVQLTPPQVDQTHHQVMIG